MKQHITRKLLPVARKECPFPHEEIDVNNLQVVMFYTEIDDALNAF